LTRRCMPSSNYKAQTACRTTIPAKKSHQNAHTCKFLEENVASTPSNKLIKLLPTRTKIHNTNILMVSSRSRKKR